MSTETQKQELVQREVFYCASNLISTLSALVQGCDSQVLDSEGISWEDDILPLLESEDYEEPASWFIMNDADLDQLEEVAEEYSAWSDLEIVKKYEAYETEHSEDSEFLDLDDWLEANGHNRDLRKEVLALVEDNDGHEWVCQEYDIDPERSEVYEHWIVSDWLARKLGERGQVVKDLCGLTVWGRHTTGQAIALDYVIQQIALELWGDELKEDFAN